MNRRFAALIAGFVIVAATARANDIVIPNNAPTTAGSGSYSTLLNAQPRSYQLVVGPQELTGMPAGSRITGITWRRPSWQVFADWPGAGFTCTFGNYDISLSSSLNPPGSLSTTYTDNIGPDVVLTRSGSIAYSGAFFPGGALTPNVNPFGAVVPFVTPYVYHGGNLLLTVRHSGNNCGGNGNLDTVRSPFTQAIGVSSYTQPDNWYAQGLIVMKLVYTLPCPSDINASGSVNIDDLLAVINNWGATGSNPADVNHDNVVNIDDLLAVIGAWGPCP